MTNSYFRLKCERIEVVFDKFLHIRYNDCKVIVMLMLDKLFLYFFIYSVLGWACETIYCAICQGKFSDRGFMYGPYCPIYGFGGMIVVMCLQPFHASPVAVFFLGMLLTTILEYMTSYVMEKLFNAKWWDYSHLPFNINGRVCLLNSFLFGIMGIIVAYGLQPKIAELVAAIPLVSIHFIVMVLLVAMSADFVASLNTVLNFKKKLAAIKELAESIAEKETNKLANMELIKQLEEIRKELVKKSSAWNTRIIEAFPNIDMPKLSKQLEELKLEVYRRKAKRKENKKEK